jgi:chemotaxis protein methyltransferase CheR
METVIDSIEQFVLERSRLSFAGHKRDALKKRVKERLDHLNLADLSAYREFLLQSALEESRLLDALTTNETCFFRNPGQFDYLKGQIIPAMENEKGQRAMLAPLGRMKMRILSAGCSTGEEPYSIAMAVLETLRFRRAWDIDIVAGDLSDSCLETAIRGYYEESRLKGIPPRLVEKFMTRVEGGALVNDELRGVISFCQLNLRDIMAGSSQISCAPDGEGFDMIFCRNVMIYFPFAAQEQLVNSLYALLNQGGYLFTGDAEPLHMYTHNFEPVRDAGCLVYKKAEISTNAQAV